MITSLQIKNFKGLKELKYYKKNNQVAIINQEVLDKLLRFQRSYMLEV